MTLKIGFGARFMVELPDLHNGLNWRQSQHKSPNAGDLGESIHYHAFDVLVHKGELLTQIPLQERRATHQRVVGGYTTGSNGFDALSLASTAAGI